jgi:hypothetical protein
LDNHVHQVSILPISSVGINQLAISDPNITWISVDLTMRAGMGQQADESSGSVPSTPLDDEERALGRPVPLSVRSRGGSSDTFPENDTELRTRPNSAGGYIKRKTSQFLNVVSSSSQQGTWDRPLAPMLLSLVETYADSDIAAAIKSSADSASSTQAAVVDDSNGSGGGNSQFPDLPLKNSYLGGRQRASWATQFRILSGRAFKNLYRDPALLAAHYVSSVALACTSESLVNTRKDEADCEQLNIVICGLFFHNVT